MTEITRRTYMILFFAGLLFISGVVFFFRQSGSEEYQSSATRTIGNESEVLSPDLRDMPPPDEFETFVFKDGMEMEIEGKCNDVYRTVLIYPETIDYRADVASAKYNMAVKCQGKNFEDRLILSGHNLVPGEKYYIIKASQGERGSWHDPH